MPAANYSALTLRTPSNCQLELLPAAGGLTNRLQLCLEGSTHEVISGFADRRGIAEDEQYRGVPLFPVVNRLDGGRYSHLGSHYELPINETARNNTLHGFLQTLTPTIEVQESPLASTCTLNYRYRGQYSGYPFTADVQFQFILNDDASLELRMSVTNRHHQAIPIGVGWHPYFSLGDCIDDLLMQLPPVNSTVVDTRMLPTGEQQCYSDFAQYQRLGEHKFDTCFALQATTEQSLAKTLLWSPKLDRGLEIWQQTGQNGLNFLQLCTAPDRRSIAIEPVSCGINAFNTGEGLIVLEPDQEFRTRAGVRLLNQHTLAA